MVPRPLRGIANRKRPRWVRLCRGARAALGILARYHWSIRTLRDIALLREHVYSGMAPQIFQLGPFVIHIDVKGIWWHQHCSQQRPGVGLVTYVQRELHSIDC